MLRRRKSPPTENHRHEDKAGNIHGKLHPIKATHEKKSTQKYHEITEGRR